MSVQLLPILSRNNAMHVQSPTAKLVSIILLPVFSITAHSANPHTNSLMAYVKDVSMDIIIVLRNALGVIQLVQLVIVELLAPPVFLDLLNIMDNA